MALCWLRCSFNACVLGQRYKTFTGTTAYLRALSLGQQDSNFISRFFVLKLASLRASAAVASPWRFTFETNNHPAIMGNNAIFNDLGHA